MEKKQVDIYSLSPMQEAMLFHSLYDQGNSYFKQLLIQVEGDFDPGLFEKSLNVLIERYDIFRTVFLYKKLKKPRQVVLQERKAKIQYQDFSHFPEDERNQKIEAWIRKDQTKPFDLSKDLLLRVSVLKTGAQQYQIVFSSHHILLDGWCMGIVFEDLFEIYGKLKNHEPVPRKKVTQYRELIRWLENQDPKETEQYWKQYLAGYEGHAKIPGAKTARGDDYKLEEVRYSLDETLTRQFNQLAREHHLTLNNVFQTIWGLMLQRYNHTDDVVFGSVVSGRNKDIPRIQEIVGLFINTIPVRVKASGDERFIDLARQVQQAALASEPYDYASLTDIQKAAQCGDSLVDHIVVFENYVFDSNIFHKYRHQLGFVVTDAKSTFEKTNYDFNVIVVPGEKFTILFQYNGQVYQREDVESCFRHFERIVRQVIENPDCRLKDIELVSPSEKQKWFEWNQTDADYPRDKTIQEIFEEQAETSPQQIALKFRGNTMTYKELNEQANQLARVLRKQGVRRGDIVGLMTERSFEMMIGMLAAVKAGGAYMPIDPEYPDDRKEFMLEDAGAPVLLVQPGLKVPAGYEGRVIELAPGEWAGEEKSNPENVNQPDDLLYVMYTSGSTGKPKGILTMHYNVMRTVINNGYIKVHAEDRLLQLSNYCFDGSTFDIYNALLNGATLVLVPKEASKDFAALTKLIREEEITVAFMTTSLFNTVVDLDLDCLKNLRKIVFGGEKASVKHVQKAVQALGGNRLINGYGPTETTVFAATYSIDSSVLATHRVPIGKPLNNTSLYVLDPWGNLQPPGIPGELCVSGDGVAKAYLNRPELNETRFVPDPFHPGRRMYRTGDLVRLLPDGHLEYLERMDNQVKIRGHRIETGEVEKGLFAHPDVLNAVVLADKDENGHSYLCAYVVLKKDVSPSALRAHMSKALPEYMIPDYFVKMDQLPFTPNGKVDLRALPKPAEALESKSDYVAPTNPVEEKLVKVWQEVLDTDRVGIHDNFFDLGGHSLKAMMLSSRVSKELNADLPLREIFARPTVQQQAAFLQDTGKKEYTGIVPAPEMKDYPVTSAQKRLYMVSQLEGMGTSYNMPYVFRIHGELSVPVLESVLQSLVDRHESLRTSFHMIDGELRQKIHPDARLVVEHYQAGGKWQEKRAIQEFIRPFDLQKAPLMRAGVLERTDTREKYLLLDFHHIVADGVSIRQWFSDFSRRMQGEALPSLPLQYKDYAYWQQHEKQQDRWKKHEKYWLNELSGELPVLQLPTDFPRPKVQRFDGDQHSFEMDAGLSDRLRQLADEQNATMYMVLFAAYHVLLAKYTGQNDLIVGSPIAGRPHADLESMVGMFANTLAVRTRPTPDVSFSRFLGRLKEQILEMAEHQDYPFEELVEKLGAERDLSRNPLFDTMFSLQKNELPALQFPDFSLELVEWDWKKSKFDMSWLLIEDEKIKGIVEFATHLFKPETVKRMVRHYLHILKQITENPDLRLSDIKLITPDEEQQVFTQFNAYRLEYPRGRTIPSWFEERVEKQPDRVAVVCGEEKWTYEELNRQANRLAHALRKKGIGREQLVGILMSPSKEMMAAILGVLKAGAAYVPIDPQYPADRIQYMLENSGASLLLTDRPAVSDCSGVEVWDMKTKDFRGEPDVNPAPVNKERDLAYVIYTSGSTGKPKGVMVEHASLINLCEWHIHEFQVTPEDKSIKYAGVGFDASVWEIFPTWMAGASLHIIEEAMRYDLEALNRYMEEQGITVAFLPTPVAEQFMQLENRSLRVLLTGGDRLGRVLPQNYTVVNNYGPTENTVVTTSTPVRPDEPVTIGKPVANNQVYVLNEHQQLQPVGVPGELCVSGESLARGYLNRPELTAEKFVPNPYVPGQKMYRTGDLVRWLPDGRLEFLGRMDEQVKIRGYRIEPGEIASRLLEHASIREAFVTVQPNPSQEPELCAYFVASSPCSAKELREHLSLKLPDYMVPVHFIEMKKLPLTRNGKVDKKALPLPDADTTRSKDDAPATPTEEQLIEIMKEILHTGQIGIHDSFFEKGGNSLKGMMLSAQVHKRMHAELPLREIFARPVVKEMAAYIENQKTVEHVTIAPAPKQAYYPVSSAQKRLYVVGQLEGMGTGYNMPHAFHIQGNLPVSRLEEAFRALVKRHESLRTSFHLIDGELMQKIHTDVKVRVERYQARDRLDVKQKIQQFIRPFDLEKAPLIRVGMIEYAKEEEQILVIDMHHIISDGVSMNILFRDLMKYLQGETLPPVSLQYKDYAVWQQNEKQKDAWKKHEQYWMDELSGELPVLDLPTDYPRPSVQRFDGDHMTFEIEPRLTRKLKRLADEKKATPYMALLAAYNLLLAKYSGKNDIIVGSPIAGRSYAGLESMVGMFANTLVVRNRIDLQLPFTAFLEQVKERVLQMYEHQDYPFEELVEKLDTRRDLSRNPLFDTMFAVQNIDMPVFELQGLKIRQGEIEWKKSKFDLSWMMAEDGETFKGVVEYSTCLFKPGTIRRMIGHFIHILEQIVDDPGIRLCEIELPTLEEKWEILQTFNQTRLEYPRGRTIPSWFEERVEKQPDRVAVVCGEEKWTYEELNRQANRLAHALRKKGIGREQLVGILMFPSKEMMAAVLGVLKAGAAYVPIDPQYPADRIQYMLKDSGASLLLTDRPAVFEGSGVEVWDMKTEDLRGEPDDNPAPVNKERDLAYVIYTSGSTGKPKGVMVEHASLINLCEWHIHEFQVTPEDKSIKYAGVGFDASVWEIFPTWMAGASLHIIEEAMRYDLEALNRYMEEQGITVAFLPTPVAEQFMQLENRSLRVLLTGGDRLGRVLPQNYTVVNNYGPTENTVVTTSTPVRPDEPVTIGKPVANNQVYVLNEHQQLQPVGVPGELCVSGESLARGYLNRPELTAEKFVPNPYVPGQKMYRTGDLVRWLPDGRLEFLGRMDEQVKIRGYRIEPGEVADKLLSYPTVKEAVVVAQTDEQNQLHLCAYFTASESCSIPALRQYLGKELPDYMIPAYFMQMEQLPLNANGKVDKNMLPKPKQMQTGVEYAAPRNEKERILAELWEEILHLDRVGIRDQFFELGGDSIKAMQIASRLKQYRLKMRLKDLFQHPTIEELAPLVHPVDEDREEEVVTGEVALTPIQRWMFEQTDYPDQWNMAIVLHRKQGWDAGVLKPVFQKLVTHHDALRMSFQREGHRVKAWNRDVEGEFFTIHEFDVNSEDLSEVIKREANRLHQSLRIHGGPLIRLGIFHTGEGDYLLIIIHHLVMDAVSWRVLSEDLHTAYSQQLAGEPLALPQKTTSFQSWGRQLQEFANSPALLAEIPYWHALDRLRIPKLPVDKIETPDYANQHIGTVWGRLPKEVTADLLSGAHRAYQTEMNDLLLSGLVMTLNGWTHGKVAVQLEGHGREEVIDGVDLTRTVGWFTSMYPVVFEQDSKDPDEVIPYVKEVLRQVPNKGIGYGILKYLTRPEHKQDLSFRLKPEINFNYQGEFVRDVEKEDIQIVSLPVGEGVHPRAQWPYKLDFSLFVENGELVTLIRYHQTLYHRETIEQLKNLYLHHLKRIVNVCREKVLVK